MFKTLVGIILFLMVACMAPVTAAPIQLLFHRDVAQAKFAAQEIATSLSEKGQSTDLQDISALKGIDGTQIVLTHLSNKSLMDMLEKRIDVRLNPSGIVLSEFVFEEAPFAYKPSFPFFECLFSIPLHLSHQVKIEFLDHDYS